MTLETEAAPVAANTPAMSEAPSSAPVEAAETPSEATPSLDTSMDDSLRAVFRKNNPERDETGRFRGDESAQTDAPAETEVSQDKTPTEEAKQAVVAPAIQPPQSLSAEEKAEWATLPPKAQEIIARREREATQAFSRQGNELKAVEPIRNVIEQHRDIFERNGVTPDDGIGRLLNAERMLSENADAAIVTIAQAYGVDLARLVSGQQAAGNQPPEVGQLHQRIAWLEGQLNETTHRVTQREQAEQSQQLQNAQSVLDKFKSDKPDWAELETDIHAELIGINAAIGEGLIKPMSMEEKATKAYDRALKNNPDAWARKQEAERKAAEAKKVEEASKRIAEARNAKSVNVQTNPAKGGVIRTMDDTMREAYRKAQAQG